MTNKYIFSDIKDILDLDTTEYDSSYDLLINNIQVLNTIEPLLITKILGFDENYKESIKYILYIFKKLKLSKYSIYKKIIYNTFKNILFSDNNNYFEILFNNLLEFKDINYITDFFLNLEKDSFIFLLNKIKLSSIITKNNKYDLLNIITLTKEVRKKLLKKCINGKDYEDSINILSYLKFEQEFDINDKNYYNVINNYLNDDESKNELINFLNDVFEKNKDGIQNIVNSHITSFANIPNINLQTASTRFIAILLKVSLILFQYIDKEKIFNNTEKTVILTQRKDYISNETDTFETKAYLIILKIFKYLYNYLFIVYNDIKTASTSHFGIFKNIFNIPNMEISNKLKICKDIIYSNELILLINDLINYYISEFLQINNDIIDSIIQYYFNINKLFTNYNYSDNIINYFYKLLDTNSEYCNKHFKFDILTLLCNYFNNISNDKLINNTNLLKAIILFHDENDMFTLQQPKLAHKYYNMSYMIINKIIDLSNIESNSLNELFLKFFYRTNSHTISFLEYINTISNEINKNLNDYNLNIYRTNYLDMMKTIMSNINISLKIINNILNHNILNPAIFRGEIILPIITLSTNVLKFFTDGKIAIYNVFNMNYEGKDIMKYSIYILHKLIANEEFKDLIQDTKHIITESLPFIKFEDSEIFIKNELKDNLEYKQDEIKIDNIPDEFLDPLIYTIIKNPVMIPNVELIFDKASIMSQIYHEKINPYTREFLDETILDEHNKNPDVINKINLFNKKYYEWKNK